MNIDEAIGELYRLAESGKWDGLATDEALSTAIEGLEHIRELKYAEMRRSAIIKANKKQPRVWC